MNTRKCRCGCGRSLAGMRRDAVWYSRACYMADKRGHSPRKLAQKPNRKPVTFAVIRQPEVLETITARDKREAKRRLNGTHDGNVILVNMRELASSPGGTRA